MLIAAPYRVPHPSHATSGGESPGLPASPSYDSPSQLQCFPLPAPSWQSYQYNDGVVPARGSIGTPRAAGDEAGGYTCSPGAAALGAARDTAPARSPSPGAIPASTRHPTLTSSRPGKRPRIAPSTLAGVTAAPGSRAVACAGRSASPGPASPADPPAGPPAGKAWAALLSAAADEATAATDAPPLEPASAGGEDSSEEVDVDASPGDGGALGAAHPAPAAAAAGVKAGALAEAEAQGSDRNREREQQQQLRQQFQQFQQLQIYQQLAIYQQHRLAQLAHAQRIHQVATMSRAMGRPICHAMPHTARGPEPPAGCAATTASRLSPPPQQRQSQRPAAPAPHGKGPAMVTVMAQVFTAANAATTRAAAFVGKRISACRSQQQLLDLCGRAAVIVKAALGAGLQTLLPASTNDAASMSHTRPVLERALLQLPEALAQHGVKAQMAAAIALTIHRQLLGPNRHYRRAGGPTPSHTPVEQA